MNYKDSLDDTMRLGFYRKSINGKILLTNGKQIFDKLDFAKLNQHFETIGKYKQYYLLDKEPDAEPWPLINFTVDFSKPHGKIAGQPLFNIAPEAPITSENNGSDTSFFWAHIENLCGNAGQEVKEWVKDFFADIFQNPMNRPGTALTIRSDEGTGKSLFFVDLMGKLLGERNLSTIKSIASERFNSWAKNRLLINFNEGSWNNSKSEIGPLKSFITDQYFSFEEKGKNIEELPNYARCVFTSNATWIMKNDNSRRFCMVRPITENYCSDEYFKKFADLINDDSVVKQFLYDLETRQITHNLREVPKTDEFFNQQTISRDYDEGWLEEVLENAEICIDDEGAILLWNNAGEKDFHNIKQCFPKRAESSYNQINGANITSVKLFNRLQNCVHRFKFSLEHKQQKIEGQNMRIWEFTRAKEKTALTVNNSSTLELSSNEVNE
jgi:hypothetical protein